MPATLSSAATKCISEVPGLAKQVSIPDSTSVRTRLSAPFMQTSTQFFFGGSLDGLGPPGKWPAAGLSEVRRFVTARSGALYSAGAAPRTCRRRYAGRCARLAGGDTQGYRSVATIATQVQSVAVGSVLG